MGMNGMLKEGHKQLSGLEEATYKNIEAAKQLSSCVRTSLGPNGMNKMVINHLEKLFITNDSATIVKELEVQHPAAKLLVMASKMQEAEVGDGTNFVVVLAGELLVLAEDLLKNGLHCSEIIAGYTTSLKKAQEELDKCVCYTAPKSTLHDPIELAKALKHVIAAKQYGNEDLFSAKIAEVSPAPDPPTIPHRPPTAAPLPSSPFLRLTTHTLTRIYARAHTQTLTRLPARGHQACVLAMPENEANFNTDNVRVAKIVGNSVHATTVVQGMCLTRGVLGTITDAREAKIAVYSAASALKTGAGAGPPPPPLRPGTGSLPPAPSDPSATPRSAASAPRDARLVAPDGMRRPPTRPAASHRVRTACTLHMHMHRIFTAAIPLDSAMTETKGTVLLKSAAELKASSPAPPRLPPRLVPRLVPSASPSASQRTSARPQRAT